MAKHRRVPCPVDHALASVSLLVFIGEQIDAPGYPPMKLYNCTCGTTLVRAQPGRCDGCNEILHSGPC